MAKKVTRRLKRDTKWHKVDMKLAQKKGAQNDQKQAKD